MNSFLKFTALFGLIIFFSSNSFAQNTEPTVKAAAEISKVPVEVKFEVNGVCNDCKKRIENAAYIKGVKLVDWDKNTGTISVVYKPSKVDVKTIQESIASIGHDTPMVKAKDAVYAKLPGCCQYRDGIEVH